MPRWTGFFEIGGWRAVQFLFQSRLAKISFCSEEPIQAQACETYEEQNLRYHRWGFRLAVCSVAGSSMISSFPFGVTARITPSLLSLDATTRSLLSFAISFARSFG